MKLLPSCWSKRSAGLCCGSAAFSFKSSRSHRLGKAGDQWSARTGSPVRRRPRHRDVAQRSPFSPSADGRLFHRDVLWAARKGPALQESPQGLRPSPALQQPTKSTVTEMERSSRNGRRNLDVRSITRHAVRRQ